MFIVIIIAIIFGSLGVCRHATSKYEAAVREGRRQPSPENLTGAEVAGEFLRAQGIDDVSIQMHDGVLSNSYDPRRRRLSLRQATMEGKDLAAWGTALHEAAHALQTGKESGELKWRRQCINLCRYMPTLLFFVCIVALVLLKMRFKLVFLFFSLACAGLVSLNIGTLGVELNANQLLRRWLEKRLARHPAALANLEAVLDATATRELGDLMQSPRFFFLSALPGTGKQR